MQPAPRRAARAVPQASRAPRRSSRSRLRASRAPMQRAARLRARHAPRAIVVLRRPARSASQATLMQPGRAAPPVSSVRSGTRARRLAWTRRASSRAPRWVGEDGGVAGRGVGPGTWLSAGVKLERLTRIPRVEERRPNTSSRVPTHCRAPTRAASPRRAARSARQEATARTRRRALWPAPAGPSRARARPPARPALPDHPARRRPHPRAARATTASAAQPHARSVSQALLAPTPPSRPSTARRAGTRRRARRRARSAPQVRLTGGLGAADARARYLAPPPPPRAGFYCASPTISSPVRCLAGTWSTAGAVACYSAAPGFFTTATGATTPYGAAVAEGAYFNPAISPLAVTVRGSWGGAAHVKDAHGGVPCLRLASWGACRRFSGLFRRPTSFASPFPSTVLPRWNLWKWLCRRVHLRMHGLPRGRGKQRGVTGVPVARGSIYAPSLAACSGASRARARRSASCVASVSQGSSARSRLACRPACPAPAARTTPTGTRRRTRAASPVPRGASVGSTSRRRRSASADTSARQRPCRRRSGRAPLAPTRTARAPLTRRVRGEARGGGRGPGRP